MLNDAVGARYYRFGEYEVDSARQLLLRNGQRVTLTPKAFHVLLVLIERHGETIPKDELLRTVWPDTVVEEISLTRNISVLRKIFGEKPNEHNFIVTVPGTGYRFVAAVEPAESTVASAGPQSSLFRLWPLAALTVIAAAGAWYYWPGSAAPALRAIPLTSNPGLERNPAISPDGSQVAFTWNSAKRDNFDIYVTSTRDNAPFRLTTDPAEDVSPTWSPDGHTIAFVRRAVSDSGDIVVVPASGGQESKLAGIRGEFRRELPSLAWSPDGQWLAVSHREQADMANALFLVSAQTGQKRRLTTVPRGLVGDYMPAFSPDGRSLAFVRLSGWVSGEIHLLSVSQTVSAVAEPKQVTREGGLATSPAWTQDARDIVYMFAASNQEGPRELRVARVSGGQGYRQIPLLEDHISELSFRGRLLVYARVAFDSDIWRAEVPASGARLTPPQRLIASTRHDGHAQYSPDGRRIAFGSTRSGSREIWIADADGSNPLRLTSFGGPQLGVLSWSPDSQRIVFHARSEGQGDLFSVAASGGVPQRLTADLSDDLTPTYSHDGRSIYFSSMRSGRWEIWKMPSEGGAATQVTRSEGSYMPVESPDGKTLYYCHKLPEMGLWKIPVEGGVPARVTGPYAGPLCGLTAVPDGLYYTAQSGSQYTIDFVNFTTGQRRPVVVSDRPIVPLSLSVSPDGRRLLYGQAESDSDLMMLDNFVVR